MNGKTIAIGVACVIAAFGVAFGIGKATAPKAKEAKAAAPTPVSAYKVAATTSQLTSYDLAGSLPAPKKEKKKKKAKKKATPSTPSTPSTPTTPTTPSTGGSGGGGSGGGGGGSGGGGG